MRSATKPLALAQENNRIVRLAKPARTLGDGFQHRLNVCRGSSDHTEDLACHGLLLQRLAQLVEQASVLDGDNGLLGKVAEKLDVLLAEWPHLLAVNGDDTNQRILLVHRHCDHCADARDVDADNGHRVAIAVGSRRTQVWDLGKLPALNNTTQGSFRMRADQRSAQLLHEGVW